VPRRPGRFGSVTAVGLRRPRPRRWRPGPGARRWRL